MGYICLPEFPNIFGCFADSESETRKTVVEDLAPMKDDAQYIVRGDLNRILFDGVSDIDSRCQITYVLWLEREVRFKQMDIDSRYGS